MPTSPSLPVSIKGIVVENGRIWLRKNPRDEWELPGGRLDEGEQPEETVVRELREELGFHCHVLGIVHSGVLDIDLDGGKKSVFVVTYLCSLASKGAEMELLGEDGEAEFRSFPPSELAGLKMPGIYHTAIAEALSRI